MKRILFFCHGNICRSPIAEYYFRHLVKEAGLESKFEVVSAATSSEEIGNPVYPNSRRLLNSHGIDCSGHKAHRITPRDYEYFDMLIGMDQENLYTLKYIIKDDPEKKVSLLLNHTPQEDRRHHNRDIEDPWYTRDFDTAWEDITTGCDALFKKLIKEL
ncbi:MAG: low molecular weight phosphotyrosine protein phosphatase [Bacteroidales bacterium]|nr:low molecular weight phosphotyrosine protein phosphatase [Bacteroidales bacterium]